MGGEGADKVLIVTQVGNQRVNYGLKITVDGGFNWEEEESESRPRD